MNVIAGVPQPRIIDGHAVVFVRGFYFPNHQSRYGLFRVDLTTGDTRMVSRENSTNAEDWVVDEAGKVVAEADYIETTQHWKMALYRDGEPTTAIDVAAPVEGPHIDGLSEDGTAVVLTLPETGDGTPYQQISLQDGHATPWRHGDLHFGHLLSDVRTGHVAGGSRLTDRHDYVFFDPRTDTMWRSLKAAFKDAFDVELVSWSSDNKKAIARVFGTEYGDGYFFVDLNTHRADPMGPAYDGIIDVAPVKWIEYHAADGRPIHAYLTTPLNREAKNLPLIVLPHGGPHARDEPGFDWISQALASRGYVVLQPQFRGSAGFGKDLLAAGFGEFGKKMQTDLSDGVRALAAQGLIDPKRVCIVGASYGGYAALAGATLDTGIYRCAVSIAGLSDLKRQLKYWHWPRNTLDDRGERFWDRFLNVEDPYDPKLADISPVKHVDKVTIPILLIHGRDDTVVPFFQSDDMADELKSAKKPYEFVVLKAEDHWLSRSETRLQMLEAVVKFVEANNPPQ
jgi:dipeptidyl aminopeptidase/acylaminoacyl peptidase